MDNFEYSIQINDQDWEEFYSTAEECGLMQVSLASEEELLLSDTEEEDALCSTVTSNPKFLRVSLCPPVGDHREPQTMPVSFSPPRHSAYKWIGSSDDVLSGSEDEEEFGSVARFLCQKETLLSKKVVTEHKTGIPSPKLKDNYLTIEKSQDSPVNESLAERMRSLNTKRKSHNEGDREEIQAESTERTNPSPIFSGESERGHPNGRQLISVTTNNPSRTNAQLLYLKDSPDISKDNQSCKIVNNPSLSECLLNGYIPGRNNTKEDPQRCYLQSLTTLHASLEHYDQLTAKNETDDFVNTNSALHTMDNHVSTKNIFNAHMMQYDIQDCILHFTTKAPGDSSAVQQNIPVPLIENLDLSNTQSNIQEPDTRVSVSSHKLSFDQYRFPRAEGTNLACSLVPATISGHTGFSRSLSTKHQSPSYRNTVLTLPEMYDFFFDDVSESGIVETGTDMASQEAIQEAIVYTPDMYEYFFVDEDKNLQKNKDHKSEESKVNMDQASPSSVVATWPEACEFFFADGPQHQDREGILFSIPPAPSATKILQSIVPERLIEYTVRQAFRSRDGKLIPHVYHGTSEETNKPTTGSLVPYLSPSRSDACLMFLALASWAVKSSDLQSSDGWKTALVANIGAVSAIRYLRRRRRTWHGPTLEPLEEV